MNNELYHHGILGQKWGVRRYQNPDGSLTTEGKQKYYNPDGSPTREGLVAINSHKINIHDRREMQKKLHQSKTKKPNEFENIDYLRATKRVSKGKDYIKQLKKEILNGQVTSFVEDSKGNIAVGKTKKGVVIRDKSGNRVTAYDYDQAQTMIYRQRGNRINTGLWG